MELTFSRLREITLGAVEITEDVDGFHFERMTSSQADAFTRANATFEPILFFVKTVSFISVAHLRV